MAAILADLTRCTNKVTAILVAGPDDGSFAAADLSQSEKYSPDDITQTVKQIDLEVARTIQETVGQGYRGNYGAKVASVTYGMLLPGHPGKLGSVEIQLLSGAWEPGILAEDLNVVRKVHLNPDGMYGSATENEGLYYIGEDLLAHYIGQDMRVFIPTELGLGSALLSPVSYEPTIVRGAVKLLLKDPVDPNLATYGQDYDRDTGLIRSGAMAVPPLDSSTKQGG